MKEGVLYRIKCDECKTKGKEVDYWGKQGEIALQEGENI